MGAARERLSTVTVWALSHSGTPHSRWKVGRSWLQISSPNSGRQMPTRKPQHTVSIDRASSHDHFCNGLDQLCCWRANNDHRNERGCRLEAELQNEPLADGRDLDGVYQGKAVSQVGKGLNVGASQKRLRGRVRVVHPLAVKCFGVVVAQPAVFDEAGSAHFR